MRKIIKKKKIYIYIYICCFFLYLYCKVIEITFNWFRDRTTLLTTDNAPLEVALAMFAEVSHDTDLFYCNAAYFSCRFLKKIIIIPTFLISQKSNKTIIGAWRDHYQDLLVCEKWYWPPRISPFTHQLILILVSSNIQYNALISVVVWTLKAEDKWFISDFIRL